MRRRQHYKYKQRTAAELGHEEMMSTTLHGGTGTWGNNAFGVQTLVNG